MRRRPPPRRFPTRPRRHRPSPGPIAICFRAGKAGGQFDPDSVLRPCSHCDASIWVGKATATMVGLGLVSPVLVCLDCAVREFPEDVEAMVRRLPAGVADEVRGLVELAKGGRP